MSFLYSSQLIIAFMKTFHLIIHSFYSTVISDYLRKIPKISKERISLKIVLLESLQKPYRILQNFHKNPKFLKKNLKRIAENLKRSLKRCQNPTCLDKWFSLRFLLNLLSNSREMQVQSRFAKFPIHIVLRVNIDTSIAIYSSQTYVGIWRSCRQFNSTIALWREKKTSSRTKITEKTANTEVNTADARTDIGLWPPRKHNVDWATRRNQRATRTRPQAALI